MGGGNQPFFCSWSFRDALCCVQKYFSCYLCNGRHHVDSPQFVVLKTTPLESWQSSPSSTLWERFWIPKFSVRVECWLQISSEISSWCFDLHITISVLIYRHLVEGVPLCSFPGLRFVPIYFFAQAFRLNFSSQLLAIYRDRLVAPPSIRGAFIHHSGLRSTIANYPWVTYSLESSHEDYWCFWTLQWYGLYVSSGSSSFCFFEGHPPRRLWYRILPVSVRCFPILVLPRSPCSVESMLLNFFRSFTACFTAVDILADYWPVEVLQWSSSTPSDCLLVAPDVLRQSLLLQKLVHSFQWC